jgi:hypothetical protein
MPLKEGGYIGILVSLLFLTSVSATSDCTASILKCKCPDGTYEYHSPGGMDLIQAMQNPESCCYKGNTPSSPQTITVGSGVSDEELWGYGIAIRPKRPTQTQETPGEVVEVYNITIMEKIETKAIEKPVTVKTETRNEFDALLLRFFPSLSQIMLYRTS